MKKLFAFLFMVLAVTAMSAKNGDDQTVNFRINPPMHCNNCENKIKSELKFEKGVSDIIAKAPGDIVTVKFNSKKTNVDKIVASLAKAGYTAEPVEGCAKDAKASCDKKDGCHQKAAEGKHCDKSAEKAGGEKHCGKCPDKATEAKHCGKCAEKAGGEKHCGKCAEKAVDAKDKKDCCKDGKAAENACPKAKAAK